MGFEIRPLVAAALSTVDGVRGYERAPASRKIGDAWAKWGGQVRIAPGVFEFAWQILIRMPDDDIAREAWIEERSWALVDALAHLIHIDGIAPDVVDDVPVLILTGRE